MKANFKFLTQRLFPASFLVPGLLLSACAGTYKQKLDFNPSEPIRVAVLPFVSVDEQGAVIDQEGRLLIDNLALVSSKQEESPAQIVRRLALNELSKTSLDLVATPLIDLDLPHHGFARADGMLDMQKLLATNPNELCDKFLSCDGVLYGKVKRWDRSYYGIQTVNSVGVELKLVSARDGRVLFESFADDSESRGVTKGPTGFSDIVIEPIRGLDSQIIVDLARKVVQKMVNPLNVKKRPVFLESAPPAIFAASHDAPSGALNRRKPVIVVMFGSENLDASFSIGSAIRQIPMIQRSPGHYYGEYVPVTGDAFSSELLKVSLTDKYGRTTELPIPGKRLTLAESASDVRASIR